MNGMVIGYVIWKLTKETSGISSHNFMFWKQLFSAGAELSFQRKINYFSMCFCKVLKAHLED